MRRQLIAALMLALMFAAGAFTGYRWALRPRPMQPRSMTPGSTVLAEALDLSEQQRQAVDAILVAGEPRMDSITRAVQAQLSTAVDSMEAEIRLLLTAEQALKLDSLRARGGLPLAPGTRLRRPPPR